MREAGGSKIHFLEVRIKFARAHEADLQIGGAAEIAPSEARAERRDASKKGYDTAQPEVVRAESTIILGG